MENPSILGIVSYKVFPALMGGQKCISSFYQHLAKDVNITLAISKDNEAVKLEGVLIERFLYNHWLGFLNIRYVYRLIKLVKTKKINTIIIEHSYFGWLGFMLRFFTKATVIIRLHNIEAYRFKDMQRNWWRIYLYYEKWVCNNANHLWFTSPADQEWVEKNWQIPTKKCSSILYGIDLKKIPTKTDRKTCRTTILKQHKLLNTTKLFLFNGTLDYIPNTDAIRIIISEIIPRLAKSSLNYRIIICGNRITEKWQQVLSAHPQIIFEGFVTDIIPYFKGVDCFINPITLGSGLKTKLIESLANNLSIISAISGAKGINTLYTCEKLTLIKNYDWDAFTQAMIDFNNDTDTPTIFYTDFNWNSIIAKANLSLQQLPKLA